jgi:hypothetical protein
MASLAEFLLLLLVYEDMLGSDVLSPVHVMAAYAVHRAYLALCVGLEGNRVVVHLRVLPFGDRFVAAEA